jgi:hypothetical protein
MEQYEISLFWDEIIFENLISSFIEWDSDFFKFGLNELEISFKAIFTF